MPAPSVRLPAVALAAILCAGSVARADEAPITERGRAVNRALRRRTVARRELRAGWILSGLGLGGVAAGAVILGYGFEYGQWSEYQGLLVSGSVSLSLGGAMLLPGLILALHGQDRLTDSEWQLKQLRVVPMISLRGDGGHVGIAMTF